MKADEMGPGGHPVWTCYIDLLLSCYIVLLLAGPAGAPGAGALAGAACQHGLPRSRRAVTAPAFPVALEVGQCMSLVCWAPCPVLTCMVAHAACPACCAVVHDMPSKYHAFSQLPQAESVSGVQRRPCPRHTGAISTLDCNQRMRPRDITALHRRSQVYTQQMQERQHQH